MRIFAIKINKILVAITIFVYIFSGLYFLYSNLSINHHIGHHSSANCEYIMGQDILCGVNIIDFINKWHSIYSVSLFYSFMIMPFFISVFYAVLALIVLFFIKQFIYNQSTFKIPILYDLLFSRGILNSKAY